MKQHAFHILATAAIAGAALTAAAPAANAQEVIIRGGPTHRPVYGPVYGPAHRVYGPEYYGHPVYGPARPWGYDHYRAERYHHEYHRY